MTRVHGLQEIEGLRATHLAHDNPFRAHTQTVLHEIAHRDLATPFNIGRTGLKPDDMRLL